MRVLWVALMTVWLSQGVLASVVFYNPTTTEYQVTITLPNGEKVTERVSPGITNLGNRSASVPSGAKGLTAEVLDDLGSPLWKGKVDDEMCYLGLPGASGFQVVPAGFYSGDNSLRAGIIADLSGQNFKVDFVGQYGNDAQRGLSFGPTFDKAKAFRLNAKEDSYKVRVTDSAGASFDLGNTVSSGRYWVIFKKGEGHWAIDCLGYIKR